MVNESSTFVLFRNFVPRGMPLCLVLMRMFILGNSCMDVYAITSYMSPTHQKLSNPDLIPSIKYHGFNLSSPSYFFPGTLIGTGTVPRKTSNIPLLSLFSAGFFSDSETGTITPHSQFRQLSFGGLGLDFTVLARSWTRRPLFVCSSVS